MCRYKLDTRHVVLKKFKNKSGELNVTVYSRKYDQLYKNDENQKQMSDLGFILDRTNIFQQYLHKKIPTMTKPKELQRSSAYSQ